MINRDDSNDPGLPQYQEFMRNICIAALRSRANVEAAERYIAAVERVHGQGFWLRYELPIEAFVDYRRYMENGEVLKEANDDGTK